MIAPFRFKRLNDQFLLINDIGKYCCLDSAVFKSLVLDRLDHNSEVYKLLEKEGFVFEDSEELFAERVKYDLRMAKSYLFAATSLHIFVVTNFCNSQCLYCQAESGSFNNKKMMTRDTAEKAVRIALQSPQNILDFEFQGGEPLSNYEIIKHIILYTEAHKGNKIVHFNLVSNLTLMNEEMRCSKLR